MNRLNRLPVVFASAILAIAGLMLLAHSASAAPGPTYDVGYTTDATNSSEIATADPGSAYPTAEQGLTTFQSQVTSKGLAPLTNYDFGNLTASEQDVSGTGIASGDGELNIAFTNNVDNVDSGQAQTPLPIDNGFSTVSATGTIIFVQGDNGNPNIVTFNFTNPIDAFGIFITGLGNNGAVAPVTITFSDGITRTYGPTEGSIDANYIYGGTSFTNGPANTNGGAEFFGFTDNSNSKISTISFSEAHNGDKYSFDNLYWSETVPEPSPALVLLIGAIRVAGMMLLKDKRRQFAAIRA